MNDVDPVLTDQMKQAPEHSEPEPTEIERLDR